ncbi:hypothetical protein LCGC14_2576880 [marine sediment metagenome]|uniref:RNA ligase domain-containing protein n=1 Tax=marine sediment metagenome TaxID=412755 RepID=A0A0F9AFM6_9ZZZZ
MTPKSLSVGKKYHKISGLYKRDDKGRFLSEFSKPEFEYLYHSSWEWTEKVDGTNMRIKLFNGGFEIRGKSDKSQLVPDLIQNMKAMMETAEALEAWSLDIAHQPLTLYGEGYGPGIQKDGGLYRADKGFILFDVLRGGRFLERQLVEEIAVDLDIPIVPHVMSGSIAVAIEYLTTSPLSIVAQRGTDDRVMEGLVGIPEVPLYNQWGERVIVKLKVKDHNRIK